MTSPRDQELVRVLVNELQRWRRELRRPEQELVELRAVVERLRGRSGDR